MAFSTVLKLLPLALVGACGGNSETSHASSPLVPVATPSAPPRKAAPHSSTQTFTWQDEVCESTGTYPAGAYTPQQLRGTYRVASAFMLLTTTVAFRFDKYNPAYFQRAAASLRHEHDSLAALLRGLEVVPRSYWRNLKHLRERQLAEQYALQQTELEGYFHPQSWLHNRYYAHCAAYADALAATDTAVVLQAWRKLVDAQKLINGNPEALEQEYAQASVGPEALEYGKMQLMTFGWSNCALELSHYNNLDDQGQASPSNKFEQLFTHIKRANCVDVD